MILIGWTAPDPAIYGGVIESGGGGIRGRGGRGVSEEYIEIEVMEVCADGKKDQDKDHA